MLAALSGQARRLSLAVLAGTILAFPSAAQAQQAMAITGRVTDETGQPLGTVNVYIDGTDLSTISGTDGSYSLVIPASRIDNQQHVLIAGLIGYRAGQETITLLGDDLVVNFALALDPIGLEEIVAVGQGLTQERRRLGATVNSISREDIELTRELSVVDALAGKAPNVVVARSSGAPASGTYINIRGSKSVSGGTQPLWVVDGTPIDNTTTTLEVPIGIGGSRGEFGDTGGTAVMNRAMDINPDDIERIEILKGPAGAAIYGASGANGVILVTTKQGSSTDAVQANIRYAYSADDVTQFNDLQTRFGQGGPFASVYSWGDELPAGTEVFDHGNELFKTGSTHDLNVTLSGGNARTNYFFSGGYVRGNGVIRGNDKLDRFNVRVKASQAFLPNFTVTGNLAYTNQAGDLVQQGSNTSGLFLAALRTPPEYNNLPYLDPETGLHRSYRCQGACALSPTASRGFDNPFWISNEILNTANVNRTFGNLRLDWDPYGWLNVSNIFGVDFSDDARYTLFPKTSSNASNGRIIRASINQFNLDNSLFVTATGNLSSNFIGQITVGQNVQQQQYERFQNQGDNVAPGGLDIEASVTKSPTEYQSTARQVGYFANVNFDFADQLFIDGGVRYDGFSTFGGDQQWFWFPNGSIAWEFTRLLGMETSSAFNFGKVRFAYGEAGQAPPVYSNVAAFQTTVFTDGWISPDGFASSYGGQEGLVSELGGANETIDPERTREFEAGIELAFVDSRVSLGAVYFDQKTSDGIIALPLPPSTGLSNRPFNGVEFQNKGWEFQLGLVPFRGRTFTWEIDAFGGTLDSEVLDLLGAEEFGLAGFTSGRSALVQDICGPTADQPCAYGVIYGNDMIRFGRGSTADVDCDASTPNASIDDAFPQAAPGDLYVGCDGFPTADSRSRVIGDPNADYNGGVRNTFTIIENLRISALIDWRQGYDMNNGTRGALFTYGTHGDTESWHGDGDPWVFPGFGPGAGEEVLLTGAWATSSGGLFGTGGTGGGDRGEGFTEDASFVKLRDVSLLYGIGGGGVSRFLGFSRVEFSFTGRNLVTWTDYRGLDPETQLTGQSNGRGIEYFNNPRIKSYTFQINLVR